MKMKMKMKMKKKKTPRMMVDKDGTEFWYDGRNRLHRDDGPACKQKSGLTHWFKHGKCHRDDGPAIIRADGACIWYHQGELHRTDGPAAVYPDGLVSWFLHDKPVRSFKEFQEISGNSDEQMLALVLKYGDIR